VLVGDGPERPRALKRAADLGLRDDVLFLGRHGSVEEILSCADLFLLPSESESFGLAALEAMACGAPVVASRAGGLPEVVADGVTGYLLPVGAIDEMAEAGVRVLSDGALAKQLSEAARALTVERFSAEAIVPRYEALYDRVLSEG
jgi:N-acetyl-alpha-D-glucosaminyl L-malate synthase BshA